MNLKMTLVGLLLGMVLGLSGVAFSIGRTMTLGVSAAHAQGHEEANEQNENDPAKEDAELSARIKQEKAEGNDVHEAIEHQKKGEAAMKAGDTKEALEHFEKGEHALAEGEEHEGKEHEKGEKGGY